MKKALLCGILSVALACGLGLASCQGRDEGGSDINLAAVNANSNTNKAENIATIGTASAKTTSVTFKNATGRTIVGMQVSDLTTGQFGANLFTASDKIENNAEAKVNLVADSSTAASESGVQVISYPNLRVTFADGSTADLHQINFKVIKTATIKVSSDNIAYLEYTTTDSSAVVNTLESEKAVIAAAEQAALAAAAAALEEEQAAAANTETTYVYYYSEDTSSTSGSGSQDTSSSSSSYDFSSDGASGGTSTSEDGCADGILLR